MTGIVRPILISLALALASIPGTGAYAAEPGEAEQRLQAYLDRASTLSARFTQTLIGEDGEPGQRSSGLLHLVRPGRFRWDYREPYEQLIVSDGRQVWMYDPELEQVTVQTFDETLASSPAMLLSGSGAVAEAFHIATLDREDQLYWVELVPRVADSDFQRVHLALDGDTPVRIELMDALGQTTRIELEAVALGVEVDEDLFRFVPPEGADVIGDPLAGPES